MNLSVLGIYQERYCDKGEKMGDIYQKLKETTTSDAIDFVPGGPFRNLTKGEEDSIEDKSEEENLRKAVSNESLFESQLNEKRNSRIFELRKLFNVLEGKMALRGRMFCNLFKGYLVERKSIYEIVKNSELGDIEMFISLVEKRRPINKLRLAPENSILFSNFLAKIHENRIQYIQTTNTNVQLVEGIILDNIELVDKIEEEIPGFVRKNKLEITTGRGLFTYSQFKGIKEVIDGYDD